MKYEVKGGKVHEGVDSSYSVGCVLPICSRFRVTAEIVFKLVTCKRCLKAITKRRK